MAITCYFYIADDLTIPLTPKKSDNLSKFYQFSANATLVPIGYIRQKRQDWIDSGRLASSG